MKSRGIVILLLPLFFLAGCFPGKDAAKREQIVVWHWMTDRQEAFEELAEEYWYLTGKRVVFELFSPSRAYSQKVIASGQAHTLPDIFGILGEKSDVASFIKAGHVLDLTPYLEEEKARWKKTFFVSALAVNSFLEGNLFGVEPGTYAVPLDLTNIQIIYNKRLLKEAGIQSPPKTWSEFIEDLTVLKKRGIKGFVCGWSRTWLIDCFASDYALNIMGEDKVLKTIEGEVPYTDSDWIRVFSLFEELRDSGGLASGIVTMNNKYAEQLFANEKAAFAFNGSWCVNVYEGMNPDLDYGVILPPKVSDRYPMKIWGGAGSSFYVNARSPLKEDAVAFLKWLTAKDQQIFLVEKTRNLPSNRAALADVPAGLREFADDADRITHPTMWPYQESRKVIETFTKGIQSIIIGEKSAQELATEVQRVKEKEVRG